MKEKKGRGVEPNQRYQMGKISRVRHTPPHDLKLWTLLYSLKATEICAALE